MTKTRTLKFEMTGGVYDGGGGPFGAVGGGDAGGGGGGSRPGSAARSRPGSANDQAGKLQRQIKELHSRHNEAQHAHAVGQHHRRLSRDLFQCILVQASSNMRPDSNV
jgi:hypothetical protein